MSGKYQLIFTLDYEIHGNGDGDPYKLMVEPTYRLMDLLERYGGKLTIMADVAEILCFKKYYEENKIDKFSYLQIEQQIKAAVKRGHDVQLHIHSSYIGAKYDGVKWDQNIDNYNLAALPYEQIFSIINDCKSYIEKTIQQVDADYKCTLFRAASWSMMPTENIYKALVANGIKYDTSVFKGGVQGGNVSFDYREAYSSYLSYPASELDINKFDEKGKIIEFPIYTEMKYFWSFISAIRFFRMVRAKFHKHKKNNVVTELTERVNSNDNRKLNFKSFFVKSPWKYDFNQATSRQMITTLKKICKNETIDDINIILIGHSKTFIPYNEKVLEKFLKYVSTKKNVVIKLIS